MATKDTKEQEFRRWWFKRTKAFPRRSKNVDDPRQFYDHRAAFRSGANPEADHLPSRFKRVGHQNRFVGGKDTITNKRATKEDIVKNAEVRLQVTRKTRIKEELHRRILRQRL